MYLNTFHKLAIFRKAKVPNYNYKIKYINLKVFTDNFVNLLKNDERKIRLVSGEKNKIHDKQFDFKKIRSSIDAISKIIIKIVLLTNTKEKITRMLLNLKSF